MLSVMTLTGDLLEVFFQKLSIWLNAFSCAEKDIVFQFCSFKKIGVFFRR